MGPTMPRDARLSVQIGNETLAAMSADLFAVNASLTAISATLRRTCLKHNSPETHDRHGNMVPRCLRRDFIADVKKIQSKYTFVH